MKKIIIFFILIIAFGCSKEDPIPKPVKYATITFQRSIISNGTIIQNSSKLKSTDKISDPTAINIWKDFKTNCINNNRFSIT